jgi:hypothetical protein
MSFMTAEYLNGLLGNLTLYLPPVLVAVVLGAAANAFFYVPWLIGTAAFALAWNIAISFVVEATSEPGQIRGHLRHTVRLLLLVGVGGGAVLVTAAPLVLAIVGSEYAEQGATSLRLIGLSLPFELVTTLFAVTAIMSKKVWPILWQNLAIAVVFLSGAYIGLDRYGAAGAAGAYLVAQAGAGIALAPTTLRRLRALVRAAEEQAELEKTAPIPAFAAARGVAGAPRVVPRFDTGPIQVVWGPENLDWELVGQQETVLMQKVVDADDPSGSNDVTMPMQRIGSDDDTTVVISDAPGARR